MATSKPTFRNTLLAYGVCVICALIFPENARSDEPFLLLSNGNVLRGNAIAQGDQIILERSDGTNLRLRREQVAHVASSMKELYLHRSGSQSFKSAAVYADDVSWCLRHDLIDEAELELSKLTSLDPSYPGVARLRRQIELARAPRSTVPVREMPSHDSGVPEQPTFDAPTGITPAAISSFATRVQPMLINRCSNAGCHRTGSDTKWQIGHMGVATRVSSKTTQRNLEATTPYLNLDNPLESELLQYMISPHAGGRYEPAGRTAQSAEYTLRAWLMHLGRYPQPHVPGALTPEANRLPMPVSQAGYHPWNQAETNDLETAKVPAGLTAPEEIPEGFSIDENGELIYDPDGSYQRNLQIDAPNRELVPEGWPAPVIGPTAPATLPQPQPPAVSGSLPKRLPTVEDPFSADLFNRQYQFQATPQ